MVFARSGLFINEFIFKASPSVINITSKAAISCYKYIGKNNKEIADKAFQAVKNNVVEVSKLLKMEINAGEVVFNQNSLTHQ